MGNAPTMGRGVFALDGDHTTGFIVSYYGSGFSSPMWTDSSGFSWAAANLGDASTTFSGTLVGNNLVYSPWLGYYSYTSYPLVYSYHLGYEYAFPSSSGVYLYDYKSGHFFYTQGNYYPFVYDFTRTTYLYFYQGDPDSRYFYDYADDDVIEE